MCEENACDQTFGFRLLLVSDADVADYKWNHALILLPAETPCGGFRFVTRRKYWRTPVTLKSTPIVSFTDRESFLQSETGEYKILQLSQIKYLILDFERVI